MAENPSYQKAGTGTIGGNSIRGNFARRGSLEPRTVPKRLTAMRKKPNPRIVQTAMPTSQKITNTISPVSPRPRDPHPPRLASP